MTELLVLVTLITATQVDPKAVVVLAPASASAADVQLVADVARELQLGGFTVTRATTAIDDEDGLRAELIKLADEHGAGGGVRLSPTRAKIGVEVWARANDIRKLRRRDFPASSVDERRVVALRAVELLRAVLLEVELAAQAPPAPLAPVAVQSFVGEPEPPKPAPATAISVDPVPAPTRERPAVSHARVWRLGLAAGGDRYGNATLAPAATLSLGAVIGRDWLVEAALRGNVLTTREERAGAAVDARALGATLGLGPLVRIDAWELGVLVSGGVAAFTIEGDATAPLIAHTATLVRPTANVGLRAAYWFNDHLWARAGGHLGWVRPIDLYLGNQKVAETGPLVVAFELALGFAWSG